MVSLRIFHDGDKFWLYNKRTHRIDGPAAQWHDGECEWWWHGNIITEYEHMMLVAQERANG